VPEQLAQLSSFTVEYPVREAHREAVRVAVDKMAAYVQARMGGNRPPENTREWAAAKFEHDTSRPVDRYPAPQLHTHVVFFNMTATSDGEFRAIQPKELYRTQQFGTAVYRSELAWRVRELGYELQAGKNGAPEIKGLSHRSCRGRPVRSARQRAVCVRGRIPYARRPGRLYGQFATAGIISRAPVRQDRSGTRQERRPSPGARCEPQFEG
jgi:conjugative relaxase-like TrwC/TraI family protein